MLRRFRLTVLVTGLCFATTLLAHDVVINEIMYHPPNDLELAQFVELHNRGTQAVDLAGWSFTKGIQFKFPSGCAIPANGFFVVCRHRPTFAAHYGQVGMVLGDFTNRLSHAGERLELRDAGGQVIDSVKYADARGWPTAPDGNSASLERICPGAPADDAANWAPSKLRSPDQPGGTPGRRNDSFAAQLPPVITQVEAARAAPGVAMSVRALISDADGVAGVSLLHTVIVGGRESAEASVPMQRVSGDERRGIYEGIIPAQPAQSVVRWRMRATDALGAVRTEPNEREPRPTFTCATFAETNAALIPAAQVFRLKPDPQRFGGRLANGATAAFGNGLLLLTPPGGGEVRAFDHVGLTPRRGGFKIRFQKDRMLDGITTLNVVDEGSPRYPLAEAMAYELYRRAGVPAPIAGHLRLWVDGRAQGYHLTFEQPNKSFLRRHGRADDGILYKSMYGNYEKRSHRTGSREDFDRLLEGLNGLAGAEQWRFIETHFNVDEVASYFAVNQCIQNWDGYFNNHFAYHDVGGTGRWEIYPWDEDKTWGDYDGASSRYDWYSMPLTFGMNGDRPVGTGWWRGPGQLSGPLLANDEFRQRFLARLREICETVFTPEKLFPFIDALQARLEPEIEVRARLGGENAEAAMRRFRQDVQSFRNQVQHRRAFLLQSHP